MRSPVEKIVAHRATNYPNAHWMWKDFCREYNSAIIDCNRFDFHRTRLANGEVHYFIPIHQWKEWTRGRIYYLYGGNELYHSDCKVKSNEN